MTKEMIPKGQGEICFETVFKKIFLINASKLEMSRIRKLIPRAAQYKSKRLKMPRKWENIMKVKFKVQNTKQ